ncbi:MAG: DoxX family protein [Hyphomicrobiales bacterium]|nr:DoxX family protein [Hyphomicrobiales bacterium]
MDNLKIYAAPLGRLLLAGLFIWAGYTKLFVFGPEGTAQFFTKIGAPIPELANWIAIIVELVGGILLLIGFQTRWVKRPKRNKVVRNGAESSAPLTFYRVCHSTICKLSPL